MTSIGIAHLLVTRCLLEHTWSRICSYIIANSFVHSLLYFLHGIDRAIKEFHVRSLFKRVLDGSDCYDTVEEGVMGLMSELLDRNVFARLGFHEFVGHGCGDAACAMLTA